jgi:hypothetical protein
MLLRYIEERRKAVQSFMQNLLAESLTWEPLQLFTVCFSIIPLRYRVLSSFLFRSLHFARSFARLLSDLSDGGKYTFKQPDTKFFH